jgi:hypothetical protein
VNQNHSPLRSSFDHRLELEFHGSRVTSDAGLLANSKLEGALGPTTLADDVLADCRLGAGFLRLGKERCQKYQNRAIFDPVAGSYGGCRIRIMYRHVPDHHASGARPMNSERSYTVQDQRSAAAIRCR